MTPPTTSGSRQSTPTLRRPTLEWRKSGGYVPYPDALAAMEERAEAIAKDSARELVWLLEHPPLYTAGTSANENDLLIPDRFPVYKAGRGGQYTYHGPGQRVAYVMLDLRQRGQDLRRYIHQLEEWIIEALGALGIKGERREGRVGIWVVKTGGTEAKIAAIGVRVRRWITFHGIAINLTPDLTHFTSIIPCGIANHGVTSVADLGYQVTMAELDEVLVEKFEDMFAVSPDDSRKPTTAPVS